MAYSACLVPPGSENMANDHEGSPGTWETLPFPSSQAAGDTAHQLQIDPRLRVRGRRGTNNGRNDGIAKRRKRSAAKWAAGSRSVS